MKNTLAFVGLRILYLLYRVGMFFQLTLKIDSMKEWDKHENHDAKITAKIFVTYFTGIMLLVFGWFYTAVFYFIVMTFNFVILIIKKFRKWRTIG
jgi:hypothetical protein